MGSHCSTLSLSAVMTTHGGRSVAHLDQVEVPTADVHEASGAAGTLTVARLGDLLVHEARHPDRGSDRRYATGGLHDRDLNVPKRS
jgi:hypothetical protein